MSVHAHVLVRVHVRVRVLLFSLDYVCLQFRCLLYKVTSGCIFNVAYIYSNFALCMNLAIFFTKFSFAY